jgi:hypothetical protein
MNSPIRLDRRQIHKNEEDRISIISSKKTTSINSFPSQPKPLSSSTSALNKTADKKQSGQNNSSTMDYTKDKKKNASANPWNGKSVDKPGKPKKLIFKKKFAEVVIVESYKKYNVDLSYNDPVSQGETTRCRCQIF